MENSKLTYVLSIVSKLSTSTANTYIFGFGIELIAVKTNYIFGNYHFGDSLGFSIAGVPIAIGFYWLILTYSTANISSKLPIKSVYIKASIGALLQVSLILLTIQVASRLDFWHLENINDKINYCLIWFLVCFIVQSYYYKLKIILSNRIASIVYGGLCVFFVGLITFLK